MLFGGSPIYGNASRVPVLLKPKISHPIATHRQIAANTEPERGEPCGFPNVQWLA
jgi:hypothetical protein